MLEATKLGKARKIPITVCHLIACRFLDVAHKTKMLMMSVLALSSSQRRSQYFDLHNSKSKQAHSAVGPIIVKTLWTRKGANDKYTNNDQRTKG